MVKVPRKVGIAIALTGLLLFGGCAYGISKIKFKSLKSEIKSNVAPFQEMGGVVFNENLSDEFLNFECQFLLGEYYSHNNEYEKAMSCYEKAVQSAKTSLGAKSFFTYLGYECKAMAEQKHKHRQEAHEDFKAALRALPDREEYETIRCVTEDWVIYTGGYRTRKEDIPFYRKHLALTEKLADGFADHEQLVSALWHLGSALDDDKQFSESEPIWNKMLSIARAENYPSTKFNGYLSGFAYHEMYAEHYPEAEKALSEALKIATDTGNDKIAVGALDAKGELYLRQNDLVKAEDALQACLELTKKLKDDISLSWAYDCLSDVARRRGDLAKREEYLKEAMQLMDDPTGKAEYLATLTFIAAQNKKASQAKEYLEQWKQVIKTNPARKTFILEEDLKNLIILYPQLNIPKKVSPTRIVDFDLKKLEPHDSWPHQQGYSLSPQQLARLMNAISSAPCPTSRK
jgi:tetratricopeptide (TPR) repeat protein